MTFIDVYCLYHEINYGGGFIVYQFSGCRKTYTILSMYHLCCLNLASNILSVLYCVAATFMGDSWQMVVPNGRFDEEMMIKIGSGSKLLDHHSILYELYGLMLEITQF